MKKIIEIIALVIAIPFVLLFSFADLICKKTRKVGGSIKRALKFSLALITIFSLSVAPFSVNNAYAVTVSTFYPVPGTTADGYVVISGQNSDWATIRAAGGTGHGDTDAYDLVGRIRTTSTSGKWAYFGRSIYIFDTSAIPDGDTILSATLSLYGANQYGGKVDDFSQGISIVQSTPAADNVLANGDFQQVGTTLQSATTIAIASWAEEAYNDFPLNAAGIASISKIGNSKFGARISGDQSNTEPAWQDTKESVAFVYFASNAGTDKDPKLVVTHSGGGGGGSNNAPASFWWYFVLKDNDFNFV